MKHYDGYMMSNVFSTKYEDVLVRFYSRTKENDDYWKEIFNTWRKKHHAYKVNYQSMEE